MYGEPEVTPSVNSLFVTPVGDTDEGFNYTDELKAMYEQYVALSKPFGDLFKKAVSKKDSLATRHAKIAKSRPDDALLNPVKSVSEECKEQVSAFQALLDGPSSVEYYRGVEKVFAPHRHEVDDDYTGFEDLNDRVDQFEFIEQLKDLICTKGGLSLNFDTIELETRQKLRKIVEKYKTISAAYYDVLKEEHDVKEKLLRSNIRNQKKVSPSALKV